MSDLKKYRDKIDQLDEKIIELVAERTDCVYRIATYKARNNIAVVDEKREEKIYAKITKLARENHIADDFARNLFKVIIQYCRDIQKIRK